MKKGRSRLRKRKYEGEKGHEEYTPEKKKTKN